MADVFWPGGVPDEPLLDGINWRIIDSGISFDTESGDVLTGPGGLGLVVEMTPSYPMGDHQFRALWLPWWQKRKTDGGCDNGMAAFWLRDPMDRVPYRWIRRPKEQMTAQRDGLGWLVTLPLRSLPR